jgi:hypothetical protein
MHANRLRRFVVQCPKKDIKALTPDLGSLCKTMHTRIASIVLASAVLAAASFLAPLARAATDYLMPKDTPFDPNPAAPGSLTRQILTYGVDSDGNKVPLKTLRISNNTAQTVYPIMRDPNSSTLKGSTTDGLYDPYDPALKEYRGYIGYEQDGKYYFGLKPGGSILVSLPLVFWNGARIGIETGGEYLTPSGLPNPLGWDANSKRSITGAEKSNDTIPNGVVMWYRAETPLGPNDDTEDQLAEWTIRDHVYLVNPQITAKTKGEIPFTQLVTLINYDVSNVDNIYLPLAMAANDVWVLPQIGPTAKRTDWSPGSDPDTYGWTGASNTIEFLQKNIQDFTAGDNQLLGQYFGKKMQGWPYYNIPNPTKNPNAPIKIPSGANVFAESPLRNTRSSYDNEKYMLSSGGTAPISTTIGWSGVITDPTGSTTLHLNLLEKDKIAFLHKGYLVQGRPPEKPPLPNPIQDGTTVTSVDKTAGSVTLSKPLVAPSNDCAFQFTRPVDDYASDAMIKLWYSWAQYYRAHWKDKTPSAPTETTILGSIDAMTATLTFKEAHYELVEGMAVKGPGLDEAETERGKHQGDAVILEIAPDKKSVILSQVVAKAFTNQEYTFLEPKSLLWTPTANGDPGYPLIVFDPSKFSGEPEWHNPYDFSQQVYLIMASMNQIGEPNNDSVSKYMQDIVGANMGFIFTNEAKKSYDADEVTSMIRDMIKSVLRGVTDFTKFPDAIDDKGQHTVWYPDPAEGHGGQAFNVFNLDPFVWFVHVVLGFSGYGFSVDDDTADVGAGGASHLQLTITDTTGLKNTNPWTIQAPYGPVGPYLLEYSGPASDKNGDTLYNAIESVSNTTPITVTTPFPHHLSNGDTVRIDQVVGDNAANGTFTIGNVTRNTFDLFDYPAGKSPVAPTGDYIEGGRWSYPLHPYVDSGADLRKVFYRVTGDDAQGTFLGTFVSVNGVDKPPTKNAVMFRVWQLGRQDVGRLLLWADLTDQYGTPLAKGTYNFTFFGIVPTKVPNATER